MIENISVLSRKLYWFKPFTYLIGVGFLCLFIYTLLVSDSSAQDVYLIPSIVGILWCLIFNILITLFRVVPSKPDAKAKLFVKLKARLDRGIYYLFALIFIVLSIAVLVMSFRLFGIWRGTYLV